MCEFCGNVPFHSIEKEYKGYAIVIEKSPDHYNGGFEVSILDDETCWDSATEWCLDDAFRGAKSLIDNGGLNEISR